MPVYGKAGILKAIRASGADCPYEQIEAAFKMIPDGQKTVVICDGDWGVPYSELDQLRHIPAAAVAKRLQAHSVNVPWAMWTSLWDEGLVAWWAEERFEAQFALLQSSSLYDEVAGLSGSGDIGGIW